MSNELYYGFSHWLTWKTVLNILFFVLPSGLWLCNLGNPSGSLIWNIVVLCFSHERHWCLTVGKRQADYGQVPLQYSTWITLISPASAHPLHSCCNWVRPWMMVRLPKSSRASCRPCWSQSRMLSSGATPPLNPCRASSRQRMPILLTCRRRWMTWSYRWTAWSNRAGGDQCASSGSQRTHPALWTTRCWPCAMTT